MSIRIHRLRDETTGKTYEVSAGILQQLLHGSDNDTVPDRASVRVPTMQMDSRALARDTRFDPPTTDQLREIETARQEYISRISSAWKGDAAPAPVIDSTPNLSTRTTTSSTPPRQPPPRQPVRDERESAYREYCNYLENAWKNGREA